jgi:TonB family protein
MRCSEPGLALWLQSTRPAGRVAELGSLDHETHSSYYGGGGDSRGKALAIHTVQPKYSRQLPEGKGVYLLHLDRHTGNVLSVDVLKSTGSPVLDRNAIEAFKQRRFRPGTSETVRMPMEFYPSNTVCFSSSLIRGDYY